MVGYFHDREPVLEGIGWLDRWREAGARHMIDFREFAGAVMRPLEFSGSGEGLHLRFVEDRPPDLVRPLRIRLHSPTSNLASQLSVSIGGRTRLLAVRRDGDSEAELEVSSSLDGVIGHGIDDSDVDRGDAAE